MEDCKYSQNNQGGGEGFEGAIIRNMDGLYTFIHRVDDLQKYKEFFDAEFKIIGADVERVLITIQWIRNCHRLRSNW